MPINKTKQKKCKLMPVSSKIIISFIVFSVVFLMAGFIVQAQIMTAQSHFWQKVATYYYQQNKVK